MVSILSQTMKNDENFNLKVILKQYMRPIVFIKSILLNHDPQYLENG